MKVIRKLATTIFVLFASVTAQAEVDFATCLADLQEQAKSRGMGERSLAALGQAKQLERVIKLDRSQPEFTQTFTDYFNARVTSSRISQGRKLLKTHRPLLEQLSREYGVPPQYLLSFWGMETNFGSYLGKMSTIDALATLACDQRRSAFFTEELFLALDVADQHQLEFSKMQGSWAGAVGHTQFMPSAYHRFGIDGDGDGKVDLWNSIPDALASAANYLSKLGWERELRWGREVTVPDDFPYEESGLGNRKSLQQWQALGVRRTNGQDLGTLDVEAALLVPSGAAGPKFLVYSNFDVIMRWNRSVFYALSVGHLADRINGAGDLVQALPKTRGLSVAEVEAIQTALQQRGFDPGKVDGQLGPATSKAVRAFQLSIGQTADGFASPDLLDLLGISLADSSTPGKR